MKCNHEWYQGKCVHCETTPNMAKENAELRSQLEEKTKYIQQMVCLAADNKLDGYRELGAKCADLERTNSELRAEIVDRHDTEKSLTEQLIKTDDECIELRAQLAEHEKDAEILRCAKRQQESSIDEYLYMCGHTDEAVRAREVG